MSGTRSPRASCPAAAARGVATPTTSTSPARQPRRATHADRRHGRRGVHGRGVVRRTGSRGALRRPRCRRRRPLAAAVGQAPLGASTTASTSMGEEQHAALRISSVGTIRSDGHDDPLGGAGEGLRRSRRGSRARRRDHVPLLVGGLGVDDADVRAASLARRSGARPCTGTRPPASPSSATRSEPRAPRVGRNGRPASDARSPATKRSSLYSNARTLPAATACPIRGREAELLEADVPGVHLRDGAAPRRAARRRARQGTSRGGGRACPRRRAPRGGRSASVAGGRRRCRAAPRRARAARRRPIRSACSVDGRTVFYQTVGR